MSGKVPDLDVSRETKDRLDIYGGLLRTWNPKINLVAPSTLDDMWSRHFIDSAQLCDLASETVEHWVDLGSGGGFPGLVVAILGQDTKAKPQVTLVESDARKSAFLRTVLRETAVEATVLTKRVEQIEPLGASVVSARALAPMPKLLTYANRHLSSTGTALLSKGENWKKELQDAQTAWRFSYRVDKSVVDENSVILSVTGVGRV